MAYALTAILDDVNRKRRDLWPITATLYLNGAPFNLTGYAVTMTIVNRATRIPLMLDVACTNVGGGALDATGRVSYTPSATEADNDGSWDVEWKATLAGVPSRFPAAGYCALEIWAVLGYPPTVPSSYNPGSIPAGTGVAGSLVLTEIAAPATPAAGTEVLWADSTSLVPTAKDFLGNIVHMVRSKAAVASQWLTGVTDAGIFSAAQPAFSDISGTVAAAQIGGNTVANSKLGVMAANTIRGNNTASSGNVVDIPNNGTANGRLLVPVQIDRQVLAAAGTVTTAAWAAGAYRKIIVDFKGSLSAANYIGLRANADATANYSHQFYLGTGTGSPVGVVCEAGVNQNRIGVSAIAGQGFSFHVEIDPRTDGRSRVGHSYSGSLDPAAVANSYGTTGDFSWNNTATDLTFLTLIQYGIGASTITGELVVSGIPA